MYANNSQIYKLKIVFLFLHHIIDNEKRKKSNRLYPHSSFFTKNHCTVPTKKFEPNRLEKSKRMG